MRGTYTKQVSDIWATSTKEVFRENSSEQQKQLIKSMTSEYTT
jgi:hypothetical protein